MQRVAVSATPLTGLEAISKCSAPTDIPWLLHHDIAPDRADEHERVLTKPHTLLWQRHQCGPAPPFSFPLLVPTSLRLGSRPRRIVCCDA